MSARMLSLWVLVLAIGAMLCAPALQAQTAEELQWAKQAAARGFIPADRVSRHKPVTIEMNGWNLEGARLTPPPETAGPGVHLIAAKKEGVVSNHVPFALDTLPECFDTDFSVCISISGT